MELWPSMSGMQKLLSPHFHFAIYGQTEVAGQKVVCLFTSFFAITHFFVLGGGWHGVSVLHISFIILANICG